MTASCGPHVFATEHAPRATKWKCALSARAIICSKLKCFRVNLLSDGGLCSTPLHLCALCACRLPATLNLIPTHFLKLLLWHAVCFQKHWQARKKLNRDPAAFTSLSVACRYASRPPSDPIKTSFLTRTRPSRVLPLLGQNLLFQAVRRFFPINPRFPINRACRKGATQ